MTYFQKALKVIKFWATFVRIFVKIAQSDHTAMFRAVAKGVIFLPDDFPFYKKLGCFVNKKFSFHHKVFVERGHSRGSRVTSMFESKVDQCLQKLGQKLPRQVLNGK